MNRGYSPPQMRKADRFLAFQATLLGVYAELEGTT